MQIKRFLPAMTIAAAVCLSAPAISAAAVDHPVDCEADGNTALQDALDAAGEGDSVTLAANTTCDASDPEVTGYELPDSTITLQGSGGSVIDGGDEVRSLTGSDVGTT